MSRIPTWSIFDAWDRRPNSLPLNAVAAAIGVDRHTIKEWLSEGAPGKTSKGYDIAAIGAGARSEANARWRSQLRDIGRDHRRPVQGADVDRQVLRKAHGQREYESGVRIQEHQAAEDDRGCGPPG